MEIIQRIEIQKNKHQVTLHISSDQKVRILPFGGTYYTEVTENIPKTSIRHIADKINKSSYFKNRSTAPNIAQIKELEKELEEFIGSEVKTKEPMNK